MRPTLKFALPLLLLGGVAGGTLAAQSPASAPAIPGAKDAARVTGGTSAVDSQHVLIGWKVDHFGFNDYFGQFGQATGTLTLDKANPAASRVEITIPVNSASAASPQLIQHLMTADFFDAANHPEARFVSTRVVLDDDGDEADIYGDLTLRGVTKPVKLEADFVGAGVNPMNSKETVGFHAETTIRRSDFGINFALPMVSDEVELEISVAFEKQ